MNSNLKFGIPEFKYVYYDNTKSKTIKKGAGIGSKRLYNGKHCITKFILKVKDNLLMGYVILLVNK